MTNYKNIVLILLALAAPVILSGCDTQAQAQETTNTLHTKTTGLARVARTVGAVTVQPEAYTRTISAVGTAYPVRESRIAASVGGTVTKLYVKEGDHVKKGQALVGIDNRSFKLGVDQAKAQLNAAKVQADLMRIEFDRIQKLKVSNAVSLSNFDQMKAQYDAAVAQQEMARVGLKQAKKMLRDATLRAPYDGIVAGLLIEKGEFASSMPPAPLVHIIDNSSLEIKTFIAEEHARDIKVGQKAEVTIESANATVEGTVVFASDRIQEATRTFEIHVRIDNPENTFKSGAYARVTILASTHQNATLLPSRSILRDNSGKPFVFIAKDGKVQQVFLKISDTKGHRTVVEGLDAGSTIITTDLDDLKHGQTVTVKDQG
jgi:membrane fusion protein (multidrug efflux system)